MGESAITLLIASWLHVGNIKVQSSLIRHEKPLGENQGVAPEDGEEQMSPCGLGFCLSQPFFVSSLGPKVSLCSATNWVASLTLIDIKRL